jgi:type VI secretion system protein ImpA
MIPVDDLIKPILADSPCGDDLSYHPEFQQMEVAARGKPETQFSPAEEPNWSNVKLGCLDLFKQTKDLRVAVWLLVASTKLDGLSSARDGLRLIHEMLSQYWDRIYPALDADDNNDPTERMNVLQALAPPPSINQEQTFLKALHGAPLCRSSKLGRKLSYADVAAAQEGKSDLTFAQITGVFKEEGQDAVASTAKLVEDCLLHVQGICAILDSKDGAVVTDLSPLLKVLRGIQGFLQSCGTGGTVSASPQTSGNATTAAAGTGQGAAHGFSGGIGSRQDVICALDEICRFLHQSEPSSPVPLLLRRAQRLVGTDFMQIMNDLAPDSLNQITTVTGRKTEDEPEGDSPGT